MKKEQIIHLALGAAVIGVAVYSFVKINKLNKDITDLKESKASNTKLDDITKTVKEVADDVGKMFTRGNKS